MTSILAERERDEARQEIHRWRVAAFWWRRRHQNAVAIIMGQAVALAVAVPLAAWGWLR